MCEERSAACDLELLFSDSCPPLIRAASYSGGSTDSQLLEKREFTGSVTQQLEDVRSWLLGFGRKIPAALIYEMVSNAVIHRDYSFHGSVVVRILRSHAQIVSLGGAVGGLGIEDILTGISLPRNSELARRLCSLGCCSLSGTGMTMLGEYYSSSPLSARINITENAFFVELPFIQKRSVIMRPSVKFKPKTAAPEQEAAVMQYIKSNGSIKRSTVQKLLKVGQTRALNILSAMTAAGKIHSSGYGKKTVYLLFEREE